jgi:hypothetical protein
MLAVQTGRLLGWGTSGRLETSDFQNPNAGNQLGPASIRRRSRLTGPSIGRRAGLGMSEGMGVEWRTGRAENSKSNPGNRKTGPDDPGIKQNRG